MNDSVTCEYIKQQLLTNHAKYCFQWICLKYWMSFTIGKKVGFCSNIPVFEIICNMTVAYSLQNQHITVNSQKQNAIFSNFQITRSSLFQTAADDASQDKASIPTIHSCHLKTMYCDLAFSPPDCRKMACVRGEELIFLAFLMKSLHQPVSNKTQWNSGELGHCLWILLHDSCYYTVACINAGFQAKSVIV